MTAQKSRTVEERIIAASHETWDHRFLIARGDALAILGKSHPVAAMVHGLPCEGNHLGYCAGVVVSLDAIIAAIRESSEQPR